jgi:heme exporter protein B
MLKYYLCLVRRDLLLVMRQPAAVFNPLVFFVLVVSLFPLGVTPQATQLSQLAAGVIWVAALLATLLSLDLIFRSDYDDGSLEQLLLGAQPGWLLALAKVTVHWLVSGLPLVILAPIVSSMLFMPYHALPGMLLALLLGTPTLSLFGAVGAALMTGVKDGGILLSLLVLPWYIPVLIFGASAVQAASSGMPMNAQLALLGALFIFALMVTPVATVAALRVGQMQG